jgi:hypothetical protein
MEAIMKYHLILTIIVICLARFSFAGCSSTDFRAFSKLDADSDGQLVPMDYMKSIVVLQKLLNSKGAHRPEAENVGFDVNRDGWVTPIDLLIMSNLYNNGPQSGCQIQYLRAFSAMDVAKRGSVEKYQYYADYYYIVGLFYGKLAEHRQGATSHPYEVKFDFDRDGRNYLTDLTILRGAYGAMRNIP